MNEHNLDWIVSLPGDNQNFHITFVWFSILGYWAMGESHRTYTEERGLVGETGKVWKNGIWS